jgi:hypothetical protein
MNNLTTPVEPPAKLLLKGTGASGKPTHLAPPVKWHSASIRRRDAEVLQRLEACGREHRDPDSEAPERIGDHATTNAEVVVFMVSARDVRHHALDAES